MTCPASPWPAKTHANWSITEPLADGNWMTTLKCAYCGEYLSLGHASVTPEVAIEIRAMELVLRIETPNAALYHEGSGYLDCSIDRDMDLDAFGAIAAADSWSVGWLARRIIEHGDDQ